MRAIALAAAGALLLVPLRAASGAGALASNDAEKTPVRVYDSALSNRPGWYPPADPESMSVLTGRRDAPAVSMRFSGGRRSLESLARAVLNGFERASLDSLSVLCLRRQEFETILWPEFPQSRPVTGLTAVDGWRTLGNRLAAGTRGALSEHGGQRLKLVRVETSGVTPFRNFKLHRGVVIVAEDTTGTRQRLDFIRSVAERKGVYKIYSTLD